MDKDSKSYESVSVTPVIKDIETLFARVLNFCWVLIKNTLRVFRFIFDVVLDNIRVHIAVLVVFGVLGYMSIYVMPRSYSSNMVVAPLKGISDQLYSDVGYLGSLISNNNRQEIAEVFNVSIEDAQQLHHITVEPSGNNIDKVKAISLLLFDVDTSALNHLDIKQLMNSENPELFFKHRITIYSNNSRIFGKLQSGLLKFLERPEHLKKEVRDGKELLLREKAVLEKRILDIEKIKDMYADVLLLEAKKVESKSVTNFSAGTNMSSDEQVILATQKRHDEYQYRLNMVTEELKLYDQFYQVASGLNAEGQKEFLGAKGRAVALAMISILFSILFMSIKRLYVKRS